MIFPLLTTLVLSAQEPVPEFSKFEMARERIGHKVTVDAVLVNQLQTELRDVRITAIFFDSERELKRSKPVALGTLGAGASGSGRIEVLQLPNFARYEVVVESEARRWRYASEDPDHPPVIALAGAARLVVVSSAEKRPPSFPGAAVLTLSVKNAGEGQARAPVASLAFKAHGGAVVHRALVRLAETLPLEVIDTFEVTVPGVPEYAALEVTLAWVARELASPPDSQFENDVVAVRQVKIGRLSNGVVLVEGQVRNGLQKKIDKVTVTFQLGPREAPVKIPAPLKPGASSPFELFVPDLPLFEGASYGLDYAEAAADSKAEPASDRPSARRTGSRKASEVDPVIALRGKMSVELRGLKWVEGSRFLAMKGGGDVAFLRLAIRDRNSKPVHPIGRMAVSLFDGAKSAGSVTRLIKDETWSTDVEDLGSLKAPVEATAYDPATAELWVGLLRGDMRKISCRADVTLTLENAGVWEWKGLEKSLESPAKPPDRAK